MPEQKPSSCISSRSYSVRWRMRCASSMRPSASNFLTCASSSARISLTARSIVGLRRDVLGRGPDREVSSLANTSPVSGSKCVICSTRSPKNETRYAVSEFAGCTSRMSPFTRKRPRPSTRRCGRTASRSASAAPRRDPVDARSSREPVAPLLRRAEAVDARDRGDDHDVAPREQRDVAASRSRAMSSFCDESFSM